MRKTLIFASLMCVSISIPTLAAGDPLPGSGTDTDPYLIEDVNDFDTFADPNNAATYWAAGVHTKLMTDIDLSGRTYTTAVIAPSITTTSPVYNGIFNGNNHSVINLKIDPNVNPLGLLGLFGMIWHEAEVTNLSVRNTFINAGNLSGNGCLAGSNRGIIKNCLAIGSFTGAGVSNSGGLCGGNHGIISCCYAICQIAVGNDSERLGGLCGENWGGDIKNCYAISTVKAGNNSNYLGDLCGENKFGSISNCYSSGKVIGGPGSSYLGGVCGYQIGYDSTIENCFWDKETSGMTTGYNLDITHPGTITNVVGKTTAEMMTQSTFTGWDFTTPVWMMLRPGEDTPRLAWQEEFDGDIAGLYGVDMVDFAYLANYWQLTGCNSGTDCGRADIDGSGGVGLADLVYISEDWLKE